MTPSATPTPTVRRSFTRFQGDAPIAVEQEVIGEIRFTVFLDGRELVTFMCSPWKLRELVLGFLYLEGLIEGIEDVTLLRICPEDRLAEVQLRGPVQIPERKILTSGCSGGVSFGKYLDEIERFRIASATRFEPQDIYATMTCAVRRSFAVSPRARGVHTSVLLRSDGRMVVAEDIGRHNTLDKIQGQCLVDGTTTHGALILSSGTDLVRDALEVRRDGHPRGRLTDVPNRASGDIGGAAQYHGCRIYSSDHHERL